MTKTELHALNKHDGNVHVMPDQGPKHIESKDCWCNPDIIEDARDKKGCIAYLHKEIQ